jgi:hypothetical protein
VNSMYVVVAQLVGEREGCAVGETDGWLEGWFVGE